MTKSVNWQIFSRLDASSSLCRAAGVSNSLSIEMNPYLGTFTVHAQSNIELAILARLFLSQFGPNGFLHHFHLRCVYFGGSSVLEEDL